MTPLLLAVPVGIALGLGVWTLLALVPRIGAGRLADRIAPYVADVSAGARASLARHPAEPASMLTGLVSPVGVRVRRLLGNVLGGDAGIGRRLRQAGSTSSVDEFRTRQLLAAAGGVGVGLLIAVVASRQPGVVPVILVGIVVIAGTVGLLAPEQLLAHRARARQGRIAAELPTVLEFLALSLSAGEGVLDALRRVSAIGRGELAAELGRVVAEVHSGVPLASALRDTARGLDLPALTRTVDQLIGALERGTPLVDVFRAQAQDARDEAKRSLLEAAGKKEVAMLVPLVFLILPVTIAFALAPGIMVLRLGF